MRWNLHMMIVIISMVFGWLKIYWSAVFSQQTWNPEQDFQEFKYELWSLTENTGTKVVDVQVNRTSKGHVYDTMKVVLKVIISVNPASKYVLKWDKMFIWMVKLESNFDERLELLKINQSGKKADIYNKVCLCERWKSFGKEFID